MSVQGKKLRQLRQKVSVVREKEAEQAAGWRHYWLLGRRWVLMIQHEYVRDEVRVRAESLAFLMLFSIMPLIAGGFFLFTVFTKFGMVQEAIKGMVDRFLETIPAVHRGFVEESILKFNDAYLESLTSKSGSVGIFALFVLIWVGINTFNNIDRTLNHIWASERNRPFLEQVRNFLVVVVAAPLIVTSALSVPLILRGTAVAIYVPALPGFINYLLGPLLLFGTFLLMYRYVPVRNVQWRPAVAGALFATIGLKLTNSVIEIYFKYGTQSAYGKAAVVPLLAFWMYVVWLIVILGAEVSWIMQNENDLLVAHEWEPTFREGEALIVILAELNAAYRDGSNPVDFERLRDVTALEPIRLRTLMDYLMRQSLALPCETTKANGDAKYVVARDLSEVPVAGLLRDFFEQVWSMPESAIEKKWRESLKHWTEFFDEVTVPQLTKRRVK